MSEPRVALTLAHKVLRIGIYKESSGPQHEFAVMEVRTNEDKIMYYHLKRSIHHKAQMQNSKKALSLSAAQTSLFDSSGDRSLHLCYTLH